MDIASEKVTVRVVPFTAAEAMVGRFASMRSAPWLIGVVYAGLELLALSVSTMLTGTSEPAATSEPPLVTVKVAV